MVVLILWICRLFTRDPAGCGYQRRFNFKVLDKTVAADSWVFFQSRDGVHHINRRRKLIVRFKQCHHRRVQAVMLRYCG